MRFPIAVLTALALPLAACASSADDETVTAAGDPDVHVTAPGQPDRAMPGAEVERSGEADPLAMPASGPPTAPDDPAALAAVLVAAEQAVRSPERRPEELGVAGHWQQIAYRRLVEHPDWIDAVLADLPAELHAPVRGNVFAGIRLSEMHPPADPDAPVTVRELPNWRITAPPPADELKSHYEAAQAATGVHWTYLAAVNLVETRMGRIRGDSVAGAQGPMQFMPATWAEWGEGDVHDHGDAIMAAARFLRWGGMPDDVNGAIFRYNRDVRYVDAVRTYAEQMQADPRAYYGYYHWQVYYDTGVDSVWLQDGYVGSG